MTPNVFESPALPLLLELERAGLELADQFATAQLQPAAVYTPFGTGDIFAGVLSGLRERGIGCPVIGISVNRTVDRCRESLDT